MTPGVPSEETGCGFRIRSAAEILNEPPPRSTSWGRWTLDLPRLVLEYRRDRLWYEVDIEQCHDAATVLDWIGQVARKTWATPEDVGHLVEAINELAGSLQGAFCPCGRSRRFDLGAHVRQERGPA